MSARKAKRADLAKNPTDVADMFNQVAARYDLVNALASMGQDSRWRVEVTQALAPQRGEVILDLAAGTGASSEPLKADGAVVVSADFSLKMVGVGHERYPSHVYVAADALRLPFSDCAFDAVTMSFGLRNVADPRKALREMYRVVRPGGTIVICEFSSPVSDLVRPLYGLWLDRIVPLISRVASSNSPAYTYLSESILAWPSQHRLASMMADVGWTDIEWRNLTGGIVALHRASRP
ncbi:MAG: class I SAM-dependent methyltransferase [Propionibacteriaceae bacterium]|nr:class I SAM-dependent methyltransferase [Propionibacteriaceae bacterium]